MKKQKIIMFLLQTVLHNGHSYKMQHNHYEIWKPLRSPPRQGTLHPNCIQKAFLHIEDRHQALQAYHQGIGCSAAKPFGFLFLKLSHSVSKQKMQTHNHTNKFKLWSNNISRAQWSIRIFLHVKHHDAKSHAAAHVCCAAKQLRGLYSSPHRNDQAHFDTLLGAAVRHLEEDHIPWPQVSNKQRIENHTGATEWMAAPLEHPPCHSI